MALDAFLPRVEEAKGPPAPVKKKEVVFTKESVMETLSKKLRSFINYLNTHSPDDDMTKSAAFTILHGYSRPLEPRRYAMYTFTERFIEKDGKVFLRDKEYNKIPLSLLIKPEHLKSVSAFISNNILPSFNKSVRFTILRTAEEVEKALKYFKSLKRPISMDIETSGLDPYTCDICGIGMASSAAGGVYIPLNHVQVEASKRLLTDDPEAMDYTMPDKGKTVKLLKKYMPDIPVLGHNMKFEYGFYKTVLGIDLNIVHCTMLGEYIIDERLKRRYNLGASVGERFPEVMQWKESKEFIKNIKILSPSMVGRYCVRDCAYTYLLYLAQYAYINKYFKRLYYEVDLPYLKCAADAELHGFELDEEYIEGLSDKLLSMQEELDALIYKEAGHEFDIDSVQQLQKVLYDEMQFPKIKTTKTGVSTDRGTLQALSKMTKHPIFQLILDRRGTKKLQSTYTLGYLSQINPITNRLHTSYMLTTTVTGRISCTNPNLQNIPKNASSLIRKMFKAPEGSILIFADYNGQEVRVLTALSRDEGLIKAHNPCYKCSKFNTKECPKIAKTELPMECHPVDIHSYVATRVFPDVLAGLAPWEIKEISDKPNKTEKEKQIKVCRSRAKAVTFALTYGSTVQGIAEKQGMTVDEAQALVDEYFRQFPGVKETIEKLHAFAIEHGYIEDMAGRRRRFRYLGIEPDKNDNASPFYMPLTKQDNGFMRGIKKGYYGKVSGELRQTQNFPMQGTSASMTKEASVILRREFSKMPSKPCIIGFIHD